MNLRAIELNRTDFAGTRLVKSQRDPELPSERYIRVEDTASERVPRHTQRKCIGGRDPAGGLTEGTGSE